jgi:hypothetical protein
MIMNYVLAAIGIASFLVFADKRRFRELFPAILWTMYFRFVEQYILVDIVHLWSYDKVATPLGKIMNMPVIVDVFFYPFLGYLYVQYYPSKRITRLLYALIWAGAFTINEQIAAWVGIVKQHDGWSWFHSYVLHLATVVTLILQQKFFCRSLPGRQDDNPPPIV